MDSTHGTNGYNFLLSTILVIDDKCEGFPVRFRISNKQDHVIFQYALTKIKECGLNIEAKVFMYDIDNSFYNAWIETFKSPEFRLWCIWHVDQAWRKNLKLIKNREKQVSVYQELCSILQETIVLAFQRMLEKFILQLQHAGELEFANYFNKYYFDRCEKWAYCYRKGLGINTNMSLGPWKDYTELSNTTIWMGKKSSDLIDQYMHSKGKVSSKQAILRNRHNISKTMEMDVFEEDDIWLVKSSTVVGEFYSVTEKFNSKKNKDFESSSPLLNVKEPHDLIIDEKNADDEIEWHVKNLKSNSKENTQLFTLKKQELLTALDDCLQMSPNKQQQTIKIVQEATIKVQALNSNNSHLEVKSKNINKEPANKKIEPQFRFKSTQKPAQKRKLALTKPSAVEKMKLTNKLLMKSAHISEKQ
ncbi:MULE domain-containing protein [Trichonephila clavipes]|nr:MULE domain-containing protein [Trichonephila clavipes]